MLRGRWGHGDTITVAGAWGLIQRTWRTRGWGGNRGEGGVTGYTCEGRMHAWFGGPWRAWVREWEVTVAHVWQVVVLVVGQQRRRVVMVVLLIMKRRPRQRRGGVCSRQGVTVQIGLRGRQRVDPVVESRLEDSVLLLSHQSLGPFDDVTDAVDEALLL